MLFFCGYKMSPKRYLPYFPDRRFVFNPDSVPEGVQSDLIVTHSVGLVQAIVFCAKLNFVPRKIVAIDPPDISPSAIAARFDTLSQELKALYTEYLLLHFKPLNVVCWRNHRNRNYDDANCYTAIIYYVEDTRHPYMYKSLRKAFDNLLKSQINTTVTFTHQHTEQTRGNRDRTSHV